MMLDDDADAHFDILLMLAEVLHIEGRDIVARRPASPRLTPQPSETRHEHTLCRIYLYHFISGIYDLLTFLSYQHASPRLYMIMLMSIS